jgi:DNA-binding beta-propeller fold protein YncE
MLAALAGLLAWSCSSGGIDPGPPELPAVVTDEVDSLRLPGLSPVSLVAHEGVIWVADPAGAQVVAIDAATATVASTVEATGYPSVVAAGESGVCVAQRLGNGVLQVAAGPAEAGAACAAE